MCSMGDKRFAYIQVLINIACFAGVDRYMGFNLLNFMNTI